MFKNRIAKNFSFLLKMDDVLNNYNALHCDLKKKSTEYIEKLTVYTKMQKHNFRFVDQ